MHPRRLGIRKPLGIDFHRRRYWALGGMAGAWRVFVESQEGGVWGWYEGPQVVQLMHWLRAGAGVIEREAQLLLALNSAPLLLKKNAAPPQPPPGAPAPGRAPITPAMAAAAMPAGSLGAAGFTQPEPEEPLPQYLPLPAPGDALTPQRLAAARADGYRGLIAPSYFGEAGVPYGANVGTTEERMQGCMQALLSLLHFWSAPEAEQVALVEMLRRIEAAESPQQLGQCAMEVEGALGKAGLLDEAWGAMWAEPWRNGLLAKDTGASLRHVALHLATLQVCVGGGLHGGPPNGTMMGHFWQPKSPVNHCFLGTHFCVLKPHTLNNASPCPLTPLPPPHARAPQVHVPKEEWTLPRDAFLRMVSQTRCPLHFPQLNSTVVFMRTGSAVHLEKFSSLPDDATAPLPPTGPELAAVAERVQRVGPAVRFHAVAVAYRTFPGTPVGAGVLAGLWGWGFLMFGGRLLGHDCTLPPSTHTHARIRPSRAEPPAVIINSPSVTRCAEAGGAG